ncbi:wax ester/triacylglycerol synthase domain-containing protein [Actinomycetospora sp. C-140]
MTTSNEDQEDARRAWAELAAWGTGTELNALDSLMWRTSRPPADSWAAVVAIVLDAEPEWERLWNAHQWALRMVPRFTERVVEPAVPTGPLLWSPDPAFDLKHHLRRVALPDPGSMDQLLEIAQTLAVEPLDAERPPWRGVLVENLEGGRAAYLLHCHHVLMDGAGATQLMARLLSRTPEHQPDKPLPDLPQRPQHSPLTAALHGVKGQVEGAPGFVKGAAARALGALRSPGDVIDYVRSLVRVASPPPPTHSPILAGGGDRMNWRFEVFECPIADLKKAAKSVGGTVNDAFVCAVLGGLHLYHLGKATEIDDVPISMPVSVRDPKDPMGGSRFTAAFWSAPSSVADPAERIRLMRERVEKLRGEQALDFINTLTPAMNLLPGGVVAATLGALTTSAVLTTSSWLGVREPVFIAGARFERMWTFGPLPGTTMCATMVTHVDTACIALNVDASVYTDQELLRESTQRALDEILELSGK